MNSSFTKLLIFFGVIFSLKQITFAQASSEFDFKYDVNRIHESLSLSKDQIISATKISDLNQYFNSNWVRDYFSISIICEVDGEERNETSSTEDLTEAQKALLNSASANTDINVSIHYLPENNLVNNEPKTFEYSFKVYPEQEAHFLGGENKLKMYLQETAFQHLSAEDFKIYQLTVLTFGITTDGKVVDVEIMAGSDDDKIDQLLIDALCQMPDWIPAEYADGLKVRQEFALTAGDHTSCTINLLNIRDKYPIK